LGKEDLPVFIPLDIRLIHELVAVKTLNPVTTINDEQRRFYDREVHALATLNHPTILPLTGFTPVDELDGPSIVIPLMKGSVQHYINLDKTNKTPKEWTRT
jgi:serine/threonine protein kinase